MVFIGQDWQNEYKAMKSVDGAEELGGGPSNITTSDNVTTSVANATATEKSLFIFNNASVKASVEFLGTNVLLEIPAGDLQTVPLVTLPAMSPYKIKTSTKDADGKDLMINGKEEVSFNADDTLSTLVINKAGKIVSAQFTAYNIT